jgi:hypothetical protein
VLVWSLLALVAPTRVTKGLVHMRYRQDRNLLLFGRFLRAPARAAVPGARRRAGTGSTEEVNS